jgi:hypothetical protein
LINVSWNDAQAYVAWLSKKTGKRYRLLTEPEYEYATRAGMQTAYPWGNDIGEGNANCDGCGSRWDFKQTAPVGSFAANAFGLYDMVGDVWAWTEDCGRLGMEDGQLHVTCGPRRFLGRPFGERPLGQAPLGPLRRPEQQLGLPGWADALTPLNLYFLGRGVVFRWTKSWPCRVSAYHPWLTIRIPPLAPSFPVSIAVVCEAIQESGRHFGRRLAIRRGEIGGDIFIERLRKLLDHPIDLAQCDGRGAPRKKMPRARSFNEPLTFGAGAQQGDRVRRIDVLMVGDENDPEGKLRYSAFTQALAGLGWTEGRAAPRRS